MSHVVGPLAMQEYERFTLFGNFICLECVLQELEEVEVGIVDGAVPIVLCLQGKWYIVHLICVRTCRVDIFRKYSQYQNLDSNTNAK